jgi:hypothetical protein
MNMYFHRRGHIFVIQKNWNQLYDFMPLFWILKKKFYTFDSFSLQTQKHINIVSKLFLNICELYPCHLIGFWLIPSCDIRSTRFKHTRIIRFFCYLKKIRPKICRVVQERRRKSGFKLKLGPNGRRLLSGAIAGAFSRTAVAPLETIRTHLMVGSHGHSLPEIFH